MSKKLVCTENGRILYGTVLKSGLVSSKDSIDLTDDAISCVTEHLVKQDNFLKHRIGGYSIPKSDGKGSGTLAFIDNEVYEINPKEGVKAPEDLTPSVVNGVKKGRRKKSTKKEEK